MENNNIFGERNRYIMSPLLKRYKLRLLNNDIEIKELEYKLATTQYRKRVIQNRIKVLRLKIEQLNRCEA